MKENPMDKEFVNKVCELIKAVFPLPLFFVKEQSIPPFLKRILNGEYDVKDGKALYCDTCGEVAHDLKNHQFAILDPQGIVTCGKCWDASGDCVGE